MLQTSPASVHGEGAGEAASGTGSFRVAAKFGNFPFKCLRVLPSSQPSPWQALSAEPSRAPRSRVLGVGGQHPGDGFGGLGGGAPGPARKTGALGLRRRDRPRPVWGGWARARTGGESGGGEQQGRWDPSHCPIRRCRLQVSPRGSPNRPHTAATAFSDPEVLSGLELGSWRGNCCQRACGRPLPASTARGNQKLL